MARIDTAATMSGASASTDENTKSKTTSAPIVPIATSASSPRSAPSELPSASSP